MTYKIHMKETRKESGKPEEVTEKVISREVYTNITEDGTLKFFRRLGGSETATRTYTPMGYCVTKLISTSPDKKTRVVRAFDISYEESKQ